MQWRVSSGTCRVRRFTASQAWAMSAFILSSGVMPDSSAAMSGMTFIGMDRGRDSRGGETESMSREKHLEKNTLRTSELCVRMASTVLQYVSVVLCDSTVSLKGKLIVGLVMNGMKSCASFFIEREQWHAHTSMRTCSQGRIIV